MSLTEDTSRGDRAREILENPEFKAALVDVRNGMLEAIALTPIGDPTTRETLYRAIRTLPMIESALQARINNGVLAAEKLRELAEMAEQERKPKAAPRSRGRAAR